MTLLPGVGVWFRALGAAVLAAAVALPAFAADACGDRGQVPMQRDGFVAAVRRNAPAVVQVVTLRGARDPLEGEDFEFFRPLAGLPLPGGDELERTFSSGFVIEPDGVVVVSAHAVFDAREIWILTPDAKRYRGTLLGFDRAYDVALVKIGATGLPVVRMDRAAAICPGAWVAAIGTPFGFDSTVTAGIVSAYPRYLHGSSIPLIQTDVALNPGSSGGPLFDADGVLVGMSTMIFSANGIYIGVSFALPVDELARVAGALRATGVLRRGEIGARTQPMTPDLARAFGLEGTAGALVVTVAPGGPAANAGLRAGDVVLGLARGERATQASIEARLASAQPGTQVQLDVWRSEALVRMRLEVGAAAQSDRPKPQEQRLASQETRLGLVLTVARLAGSMPAGLYVDSVSGSSLLAGLEHADRIVAVNGTPVTSIAEFDAALERVQQRPVVALLVMRSGAIVYVPVSREGLAPG